MNAKKILVLAGVCVFVLSVAFFAGIYIGAKGQANRDTIENSAAKRALSDARARIIGLEGLLDTERKQLESIGIRNTELERLNTEQRKRIDKIIGSTGQSGQIISDIGDEIQKILDGQ